MTLRIIIADTETHDIKQPRPVEIAWVECDHNLNIIHRVESLIDPECQIAPGASGVHGITNKDVADQPTLDEFFNIVHDKPLSYGDVIFVAHNAQFDLPMVAPYIGNLAGTLCTLKLARRLLPEAENHKLQTLRYQYNLDAGGAHRAMGDVIACHSLLLLMLERSGMSFEDMLTLQDRPIQLDKMPFGKHKGTKLTDLPPDYLRWLRGLDNLDDNLRYSLNNL